MVLGPAAVDCALFQFVPMAVTTLYQYCALLSVALVHDVVAIPVATCVNPLVAEVVD